MWHGHKGILKSNHTNTRNANTIAMLAILTLLLMTMSTLLRHNRRIQIRVALRNWFASGQNGRSAMDSYADIGTGFEIVFSSSGELFF